MSLRLAFMFLLILELENKEIISNIEALGLGVPLKFMVIVPGLFLVANEVVRMRWSLVLMLVLLQA